MLGEKNPSDLLTKYMTAELSMKRLDVINVVFVDGRDGEEALSYSEVTGELISWVRTSVGRGELLRDGPGSADSWPLGSARAVAEQAGRVAGGDGRRRPSQTPRGRMKGRSSIREIGMAPDHHRATAVICQSIMLSPSQQMPAGAICSRETTSTRASRVTPG